MPSQDDYRLYLEEKFSGIKSLMNAQFEIVHDNLDTIKEQTIKTNSRVSHHDDDIAELKLADTNHLNECPAMPKIQEIKDDLVEYKWFKQHPKLGLSIIAVASTLILFNIFGIINKNSIAKDLLIFNKEKIEQFNDIIMTIDSLRNYYHLTK